MKLSVPLATLLEKSVRLVLPGLSLDLTKLSTDDSITDYKKLGRDKSISLVDGKLGESEQELVAQTQAQDHGM